jgi:hypothetical protein
MAVSNKYFKKSLFLCWWVKFPSLTGYSAIGISIEYSDQLHY